MIRVNQVMLSPQEQEDKLADRAAAMLKIDPSVIAALTPVRRAVDARRGRVRLSWTVDIALKNPAIEERALRTCGNAHRLEPLKEEPIIRGTRAMIGRPLVVGSGPAGLFAALALAEQGYRPLVLERGGPVDQRAARVAAFFAGGALDPECNVQFGEGGAGTFSDGKLTTRIRDPRCAQVVRVMVEAGADPGMALQAKPHVGTDRLQALLPEIRKKIEKLGGSFRFYTRVDGLLRRTDGALRGVTLADGTMLEASAVILALGHSARETLRRLSDQGVLLQPKPFAMGVRIEHQQQWLDRAQYGDYAGHPALGAADYSLSQTVAGRSVYTFCMCPGGSVVNASSEAGRICVNGMSDYARAGDQCNAAWVCQVGTERFPSSHPLAGVELQRQLEAAAFAAGGGLPPAQRLGDFLDGRVTAAFGDVTPTVRPGVRCCDLNGVLPDWMAGDLKAALPAMDRRLPGFAHPDAVLTAVEARTSSAVRMLREADGQAAGWNGLFPAGEGAGYAGGIMSSAVDGMTAAGRLMAAYAPPDKERPWT